MPYENLVVEENQPDVYTEITTPVRVKKRRFIRFEKVGPAFWTIASLVSMLVNLILIVALISVGKQLFSLKSLVQNQLIGGLYNNFQMMDAAHIRTTIPISTEVPAKFDLPVSTNTTVTLTEDTIVKGMTIYNLNAGALFISQAKADITLPAGTDLPVALNIVVPVDQKIPVNLLVDVDIPLNQTDLHPPFVGLQDVVKPYYTLLGDLPDSWQAAACALPFKTLCEQPNP